MNIKFNDWWCALVITSYNDGNTALLLTDIDDGTVIAKASINIPHANLATDEVAIKDYAENEGMFDTLRGAGVISAPFNFLQAGYEIVPVCKLTVGESNGR